MSLLYRIAADLLVAFHMGYVLFVVIGFLLVLLGIVLRWKWIRNFKFRTLHLSCILLVAGEALLGIPCPLTVWEKDLRGFAGQATYGGDFVANWIHSLLFFNLPPWAFTLAYTAFAGGVLLTFVLAPPQRASSRKPVAGSL